jgi:glycerol-3-phosphate dehydrogenase
MKTYDFIVIGAGVVGCAIARELSSHGSVLVLERRERPGMETSRYNSGVIHSGIHLPPSFLKARLAREGSALVRDFCRQFNVPNREVGMHIVVTAQDCFTQVGQLKQFTKLLQRARQQDIDIEVKSGRAIRTVEPSVRCLLGVHVPGVRIIDQCAFLAALIDDMGNSSATIDCCREVTAIEPVNSGLVVTAGSSRFRASVVINAAGLYADQVARLADVQFQHYYYRGEYYEIEPSAGITANGLVYPLPPRHSKGLGIHLTPTTDGRILLGPNTKRVSGPDDYRSDKTPPEKFLSAVRAFLPSLTTADISWAFSGIRPKTTDEPIESDFVIERHPVLPMLNLIGIESPGLTASLALARHVRALALA